MKKRNKKRNAHSVVSAPPDNMPPSKKAKVASIDSMSKPSRIDALDDTGNMVDPMMPAWANLASTAIALARPMISTKRGAQADIANEEAALGHSVSGHWQTHGHKKHDYTTVAGAFTPLFHPLDSIDYILDQKSNWVVDPSTWVADPTMARNVQFVDEAKVTTYNPKAAVVESFDEDMGIDAKTNPEHMPTGMDFLEDHIQIENHEDDPDGAWDKEYKRLVEMLRGVHFQGMQIESSYKFWAVIVACYTSGLDWEERVVPLLNTWATDAYTELSDLISDPNFVSPTVTSYPSEGHLVKHYGVVSMDARQLDYKTFTDVAVMGIQ
jgi:hypothetical protein